MVQVTLMEIMMTERNDSRDGVGGTVMVVTGRQFHAAAAKFATPSAATIPRSQIYTFSKLENSQL